MYLRIRPRKKIGIEIPISEASRLPWSNAEPYLFAARKPSGIAEADGEDHRSERQLDRGREAVLELLRDRAERLDARAQVQVADGLDEVAPVLDVQRLVEPELVADLCDRLRRRPLAEERLRRRARQQADPDEDEERDAEEDRKEQEQPADDEAKHLIRRLLPPHTPRTSTGRSRTARAIPGSGCSRRRSSGTPAPASVHVGHHGQVLHDVDLCCLVVLDALGDRWSPDRALDSMPNSLELLNPNCVLNCPKWTLSKLAGSPKSPVHPSRNTCAWPSDTCET